MQIDPRAIKDILVVRNDRFGEFLLNIPALRALRETFLSAKISIVVNPYVKELAKITPFIDEIIEWERIKHPLSEKLQFIGLLRKKHFDMAIMLNPSKEFNIFTYLAGIPIRVGYARKWGFLLTHKIEDKKYLGERHEVEYNLELVGLLEAKTENKTLSLTVDNSLPKDFNIEYDYNLIALHPFTSDPIKQWPMNNFCQLARRLTERTNTMIVIIGGNKEQNKSRELYGDLGDKIINLVGKTTLRQLASLLKRCALLVSCDSGPLHLACAVGTPVIAIFRNDIPGKSARRWGPWGKGHIVIEKDNLCDITVDEVLNRIKEIL